MHFSRRPMNDIYKYCPFSTLDLSARAIAEGYVHYCENSHLSKRQKQTQGINDDADYMNAMHHATDLGPLDTGLSACKIIAEEFPQSKAYEQLLVGHFGYLLNSIARCESNEAAPLLERIAASARLSEVVFDFHANLLSDEAREMLNTLRHRIAKKRKWKHKLPTA